MIPEPAGRPRRAALVAALATLLLHAALAWRIPMPGTFLKYNLAAEQYLRGELPAERLMDFSPSYFYLSVLAERLTPDPAAFVHGLQICLAGAAAGLLFLLLARRFSPAFAAAMTAVFAVDRHVLVYERILEPEVFLLFFLLAFLFLLGARSRGSAWLAGVCAGLCLATRPTFLPVFLLAPLCFLWRGDRDWRRRSLALLLPVALATTLLMARAAAVTGDPRTPVMNPGTVFFEGNNPLSHGTSAIYPPLVLDYVHNNGAVPDSGHVFYRTVARADAGRELSIAEVNAFWAGKAAAFLRAEPRRAVELLLEKLTRACHGFRWHDIPTAWQYDRRVFVPTVSFALLASLALFGALWEARRWRESFPFFLIGLAQLGVMLVFYVSARQRMVLIPVALYFVAAALERLAALRWRAVLPGVMAALLAVLLTLPDDVMRDEVYQRRGHLEIDRILQEIRAKSKEEPLARHADLAVEAMASAPWWLDWLRPAFFPRDRGTLAERVADALAVRPLGPFPVSATFDRAAVDLEAGRPREAAELLAPLVEDGAVVYRGGRQPSQPLLLLGRAYAQEGRRDLARETLERALERAPGDPFVLTELAALTGDSDYFDPLFAYWSRLDAQYLFGRAALRHDRPQVAAEALAFVTARLPDHREARIYLAVALARLGRDDEAARQYLEASRIRLEPVVAGDELAALFRRWSARHATEPEAQLYAAQVLHQLGFFREALALLTPLELSGELRAAADRETQRLRAALGDAG